MPVLGFKYQIAIKMFHIFVNEPRDIRLQVMGLEQGGIIRGNLGTRFPGNLKVSQEILITNPITTCSRGILTIGQCEVFPYHESPSLN